MGKLENKVVLITGGISGIGAASAKLFAEEGAQLVLVDMNEEVGKKFEQSLKEMGHEEVVFVAADVTDREQAQEIFDHTVGKFGSVDVLFNNAGVGWTGPTHEYSYEDYRKVVEVDLDAVFSYSQFAIRQMLKQEKGGVIVNTASMYGWVGAAQSAAYNAAKGGVINLTRSLGVEYAQDNIRVNALAPGYIDTPIIDDSLKEDLAATTPMGRLGKSEEIAKAALFLASDDSSYMTGNSLIVDGGYTAQ